MICEKTPHFSGLVRYARAIKSLGRSLSLYKDGNNQVLRDFNHCLFDLSGLAYFKLYRLWATFYQTACCQLDTGFFASPAFCDRGFDRSDLGNRSLFGTHIG
jgi:hypothetical protein